MENSEIKEIVREEIEKAILLEDDALFLRRVIASMVKDELDYFGYKVKSAIRDNKSNLSQYTAKIIGEEISKLLNEEEIKKIIAETLIEEISRMPTYILKAITDILQESMTGISNQIHSNNTRTEFLKRIVSEKFNVYIP